MKTLNSSSFSRDGHGMSPTENLWEIYKLETVDYENCT
jgi:hypothetical protein